MVFGLFSKEKSLEKTIAKATNKLSQQVDRWAALESLKKAGTDEAIFGLCKRFGVTSTKGIEDEQEKEWVVDALVSKGKDALPPLRRYMKTAGQLAFPLRVVERVGSREEILEIADELFKSEPPGYVRMPERRIDLVHWFSEWKGATDDEVITRLTPYTIDFDENSRFAAIDGLSGKDPSKIAAPLVKGLLRPEEESGRIKRTIVEALEKSKAPLGADADAVAAAIAGGGPLAQDFKVAGGIVKKA